MPRDVKVNLISLGIFLLVVFFHPLLPQSKGIVHVKDAVCLHGHFDWGNTSL